VVVIVALVGVAACSTDHDVGSPGTHLQVDGVATAGAGLVQPGADSSPGAEPGADALDPSTSSTPSPSDPAEVPTIPSPSSTPGADDAVQVPFSGSVTCDGAASTGTGIFESTAVAVCDAITTQAGSLEAIGATGNQACAQIYGGPQHVTIKGSVDGAAVDVSVNRSDGCGIADWQRLEWLIGAPER